MLGINKLPARVLMWLAKMKVLHTNCLVAPKCKKWGMTDLVYLVNYYEDKRNVYYSEIHMLEGEQKAKKGLLKELRAEPSFSQILPVGNIIITLNKEPLYKRYYAPFFDRSLFQNKPIVLKPDGYEYWEFASWSKQKLLNIAKKAPPVFKIELLGLSRIKQEDIYIPRIFPDLTDKQRRALQIAIQAGYYGYPRKSELEKLGKAASLSRQTFQEHLRKAEAKVMTFLSESL
jgi:hypothetical protein